MIKSLTLKVLKIHLHQLDLALVCRIMDLRSYPLVTNPSGHLAINSFIIIDLRMIFRNFLR
jgi:hypothetical protein